MAGATIHRRVLPDNKVAPHPCHEAHYYPFDTIGKIKSHIVPHYAIFNCGKKLQAGTIAALGKIYDKICGSEGEGPAILLQITHIYHHWTMIPVPESFYETKGADLRWDPDSSHSEGGSNSGEGNDRDYKSPGGRGGREPSPSPAPKKVASSQGKRTRPAEHTSQAEPQDDATTLQDSVISWMSKSTKAMSDNGGWEKPNLGKDVAGYTQESPRRVTAMPLDIEGLPEYVYSPRLYKHVLADINDERRYKKIEAREIEAMETDMYTD
jgi:hypothetical protein